MTKSPLSMRVFSFALMASSAIQSRADGTIKAAGPESRSLYGSDVVHTTSTGQDSIASDKLLIINDTSAEEEKMMDLVWLGDSVARLINWTKDEYFFKDLIALEEMHPVGIDAIAEDSPEFEKLTRFLVKGNQRMVGDLLRTRSDNRWPVLLAVLTRFGHAGWRDAGRELMVPMMADWRSQGIRVDRLLQKFTDPYRIMFGFTDYERLYHDVVWSFCRFKYMEKGDAEYLKAMMELHEGKGGFIQGLHYILQKSNDKARAVELLDLMLGELIVSGVAPHKAFQQLALQQYKGELFDDALLPLLNKCVILHNKFSEDTTTLSKELRLLRGASEPKKTVEEHAETWLEAQGTKAKPQYVLRLVFREWQLHGAPFGGEPNKGWNKLRDEYKEFLATERAKTKYQ
ncbi:unnamed protein product [Hyaloperonospora brassicae]|uniref:RxLR effector candidate protein n=1 Tax=Hyaloperonospora brassicae TaxID=162125 RepID=A0AAV0UXE1_HYABA|nr:unnamed protein product [Hyaloperonospora brassicae]